MTCVFMGTDDDEIFDQSNVEKWKLTHLFSILYSYLVTYNIQIQEVGIPNCTSFNN